MKIKLRTKIFLGLLIPFVVLMVISSYAIGHYSDEFLKREIRAELEIAGNSRANHIDDFIKLNFEKMDLVSSRTKLRSVLSDYNSSPNTEDIDTIRGILNDAKKPIPDFESISILDDDGKVLVSTNQDSEGNIAKNKDYFVGKEEDNVNILTDNYGEKNLYFSGPIVLEGNKLGTVFIKSDVEYINSITGNPIGLGETGEIYIIGSNNIPLTPLKLVGNEDVQIENSTAIKCINEDQNTGEETVNYAGDEVISYANKLENAPWCIVANIDNDEAMKNIVNLFWIYFYSLIISILIYLFIANYIAKYISEPIEKLKKDAQIIAAQDINHKINIKTGDEIEDLANTFSEMVLAIKQSYYEIDSKVEEQTKEIGRSREKLENQQMALLNVLEDVNEEKLKTERERNKIQAILSSIGDAVFVVDLNGKILMFNSIAEKLSGYSQKEAVGQPYKQVLKFIFEKDGSVNDQFIKDAISNGKISYMTNHTLLVTKHGKHIPVADSASPLLDKNKKIIGCVVVFHDVTKERELAKMKDEFLNIAAHDLRTPMTAIKGYNDMILNGDFGQVPEGLREPLEESQSASERLIRLVNDFLNSSRIERGKITVQPKQIDIVPIVNTLIKQIEPIAKKKNLQLSLSPLPEKLMVYTDSDKIQQVITNLIDNAIKYTKAGSIKFDVKVDDKKAVFSVTDTGAGISEEKQESLFTKYYQVSGGTKKVIEGQGTGLGLGLYISRLIVEGCGGKIWVESRPGHGSRFNFTLPLASNNERSKNADVNKPGGGE